MEAYNPRIICNLGHKLGCWTRAECHKTEIHHVRISLLFSTVNMLHYKLHQLVHDAFTLKES